jgi:hypothetical protein
MTQILWENRKPTPEEAAALAAASEAEARAAEDARRKWTGVPFEGALCSATRDDQAGLMAVLLAIQLQGETFQPTRFEFANGETLAIHLGNYRAFLAVWMPFRQSFFRA